MKHAIALAAAAGLASVLALPASAETNQRGDGLRSKAQATHKQVEHTDVSSRRYYRDTTAIVLIGRGYALRLLPAVSSVLLRTVCVWSRRKLRVRRRTALRRVVLVDNAETRKSKRPARAGLSI